MELKDKNGFPIEVGDEIFWEGLTYSVMEENGALKIFYVSDQIACIRKLTSKIAENCELV